MTDEKVFSFKDFEGILIEAIETINDAYSDKMEMRDISLLSWYSMLVCTFIELEYNNRIGDLE